MAAYLRELVNNVYRLAYLAGREAEWDRSLYESCLQGASRGLLSEAGTSAFEAGEFKGKKLVAGFCHFPVEHLHEMKTVPLVLWHASDGESLLGEVLLRVPQPLLIKNTLVMGKERRMTERPFFALAQLVPSGVVERIEFCRVSTLGAVPCRFDADGEARFGTHLHSIGVRAFRVNSFGDVHWLSERSLIPKELAARLRHRPDFIVPGPRPTFIEFTLFDVSSRRRESGTDILQKYRAGLQERIQHYISVGPCRIEVWGMMNGRFQLLSCHGGESS